MIIWCPKCPSSCTNLRTGLWQNDKLCCTEFELLAHIWFKKYLICRLLWQKKGMQMLSIIIMCAQLRIRIADLAVTVHICMVPHTCRETIFLAGNPVSMETSNYLTQKNNTGAGGMLTQSELSFSTFMWLLNNCMFCMSLNYTGCIRKTKKDSGAACIA